MPALLVRQKLPRWSDPGLQQRILDNIRAGLSVRAIAGDCGISRETYHGWLRDGRQQLAELEGKPPEPGSLAEFAARCERAYSLFEQENVGYVTAARAPDAKGWIPAMAMLRSRNPEEWVEKHDRDVAQVTIGTLNVVHLQAQLSPSDLASVLALAQQETQRLLPPPTDV